MTQKYRASEHDKRLEAIEWLLVSKYNAIVAVTDAGILRKYGVAGRHSGIPRGWPDLVALLNGGRTLLVEVKTGKAAQTDAQIDMQEAIENRGHEYVLASGVDEVIAAMERKT